MKYNTEIQEKIKSCEDAVANLNQAIYEEQLVCDHIKVAKVTGIENDCRVCLDCGLSENRNAIGYLILEQEFMAEITSDDYYKFSTGFKLKDEEKTSVLRTSKDDRMSVLKKLIEKRRQDTVIKS